MSNKALITVIILLLLGGGYWFYTDFQNKGTKVTGTETPAPEVTPTPQAKMSAEVGRVIGKWKSTEDTKFTREFREDGTVTDMYEGDASATSNGTWSQVVDVAAEPFTFPAVGDATLLKLVLGGEAYYFAISADTTSDKLMLIHLSGRGNILSFTRVN